MAGYDFNAELIQEYAERERAFGEKPFTFGYVKGGPSNGGEPAQFYIRANPGFLGIKQVVMLSDQSTGGETFQAVEDYIISMLDPRDGAHERFHTVLANPDFPITFEALVKLEGWLLTASTDVPPTEPNPSSASSSDNGPSSTAPSSIAPEGASTISA